MKVAKVTPIFKKGDSHLVSNYRPISVLSCFSKILERLVYTRTTDCLNKFNILSNSQFGFRAKHSTTHAILHLIDKVTNGMDNSEHTLGIFLDFSKAFDSLDHNIILFKLNYYGIRGSYLEWFRSYLSNRKQYVSIDGAASTLLPLTCGVPQGSIIGPLLFLIYINDISKSSDAVSFILFADDSNLFYSHTNINTLVDTMNSQLVLI